MLKAHDGAFRSLVAHLPDFYGPHAENSLANYFMNEAVPRIALQAFGLFNPFMREVAEMYYLFDSGFILDDSELRATLGPIAKTPYEQGVRETIAWMKR